MFAMQGFGIFLAGAFVISVSTIFQVTFKAPSDAVDPIGSTVPEADYVWRIILMFGSVPVALTYYWRMKMPETARYTALIMKNQKQAATYMYKVLNVDLEPEMQEVGKQERTWFLLDIAYYSQNMFQKDIFTAVRWLPPAASMNAFDELFKTVKAQSIIALCGTVPGYWFLVPESKGKFVEEISGEGEAEE